MKHLTSLLLFLTTILLASAVAPAPTPANNNDTIVYICTGKSSKRFHSKRSCRGLDACQGEIRAITLQQAKQLNRTPCKICIN